MYFKILKLFFSFKIKEQAANKFVALEVNKQCENFADAMMHLFASFLMMI